MTNSLSLFCFPNSPSHPVSFIFLSLFLSNTQGLQQRMRNIVCVRARANCLCSCYVCVCAVRAHMCLSQWCEKSRGTYLLSLLVVGFQFDAKRSAHLRSHTLSLACVCAWACPLARCSSGVGQTLSLLHFSQCGTTRLQPAASHGS